MIYEIINPPKRLDTALFDRAVSFAVDYLNIDLDLVVEFQTLPKGQCGVCDYDDDETSVIISKRMGRDDIIRTLFHEMVHVKQYADGRLESGSPQRWLGSTYDCDYSELPWEIEAFELEEKMMKAFCG